MQQPLVSVIITTYNRLNFLQEAVDSVKIQTFKNWELLIIDDASPDNTWEWLTELQNEKIRVFRQEKNTERSAARNRGLSEAKGEFIMFLDDDDRLRSDALKNLVKPLSNNSKLIGVVGARWNFREGKKGGTKIYHSPITIKKIVWPEVLAGWVAPSGQALFRTSAIRQIEGYKSLPSSEDIEFWLRVSRLGVIILIPQIVYERRDHGKLRIPKNYLEFHQKICLEFIEKLPVEKQKQAKHFLESRYLLKQAENEYKQKEYQKAFTNYFQAFKVAPKLVFFTNLWSAISIWDY